MIRIVSSRARPRRLDHATVRDTEDEGSLLTVAGGDPVSLNVTARRILELCDGARSVAAISEALAANFGSSRDAVLSDVRESVRHLADIPALELNDDTSCEAGPADIDWSRIAAPQPDQYDTEVVLDLMADKLRGRWLYCGDSGEDWWQPDGRVDVGYCYNGPCEGCLPRDQTNAPLDHPNIAAAEEFLHAWPVAAEQFGRLMRCLHPLIDPNRPSDESAFLGGSSSHSEDHRAMFGTLYSTINCPLMLADNCVHEMAHQKLFALGVYKESSTSLITNDPQEMYASPVIVDRPRPMTAVVHGVYAFCYVAQLELHVLDTNLLNGERRERLRKRLLNVLGRVQAGAPEIEHNVRSDACGAAFLGGLYRWIHQLLKDGRDRFGMRSFPEPKIRRPAVAGQAA
jgi:hypothetical protein